MSIATASLSFLWLLGGCYYIVPPLPCFLPVFCLGGLIVRPNPFLSSWPARSLRLLLSSRFLVRFHVRIRLRFRIWYRRLRRPLLHPLQVYAGLLPPPPRHPRSQMPSGPLTEVHNWSRCNILRDRVLPPCDRLSDPLEARFPHCVRQRRVLPIHIRLLLRLIPGDPPHDPVLETVQGQIHPWVEDPRLRPEHQHRLYHRPVKISQRLRICPLLAQNLR